MLFTNLVERRLLRDGFSVFSFPLGIVNSADIRKSAQKVQDRVKAILVESEVSRIDVVGHSMGGLICLYYIQELGGRQIVRRMVSLGTPYSGTWTALGGALTLGPLAPSSWQLLPYSRFLRRLLSHPLPPEVGFYSIRGRFDAISPLGTTHLPGAMDILVPCSHAGLVTQPVAYQAIFSCLTGA